MKRTTDDIDDEIHLVEKRLALRRETLDRQLREYRANARARLGSPRSLAAAVGVGYAIDRLLLQGMGRHADASMSRSALATLVSAVGIGVINGRFGGLPGLLSWVSARLARKR